MLIDLHAHTSGVSECCRMDAEGIVKTAKENGIDGIVLTNHYQKSYIKNSDINSFLEKYINEYYVTVKAGEKIGVKVYWGIELTAELYPNVHMLIYGVPIDFVSKYPTMFDYTQKELYEKVKNEGGALVQAHPFRNGTTVLDVSCLDGVEINCHPLYKNSYSEEILNIAKKNNLAVTCGGDFHADTYRPKCGMYLSEDICDTFKLCDRILTSDEFRLCIQEPNEEEIKAISYLRNENK